MVRQTISKWEQGLSVPDSEMLISNSETLDTPVSILLGENVSNSKSDDLKAITPSISALLVINILYGKKAILFFLRKSYIENKKVKYTLLAFLLPLIIGLLTYISCVCFINLPILNTSISANKIIILLWALIAEELGWRGFLQENLNKKLDKKFVPLIIGIIWSLWHYHFFLLGTITVPIILFTISCIIDSYIYYWLTDKSKQNIIPASIFHFMGNLLLNILLIYPNYHNGNILPYIFYVISSFIVMICFIKWESFNKQSRCRYKNK